MVVRDLSTSLEMTSERLMGATERPSPVTWRSAGKPSFDSCDGQRPPLQGKLRRDTPGVCYINSTVA